MNLKEQREAAFKAANAIVEAAKGREMTDEETATLEGHVAEVKAVDEKIKRAEKSAALISQIGSVAPEQETPAGESAKSLGEHFAKSVGQDGFARLKTVTGTTIGAPEFKAATDVHVTTGSGLAPLLTQVDRNLVRGFRPGPVIADLLGAGVIGPNSNAITYFVEGALEGDVAPVAQGGQKPQLHNVDPTPVTDALKKIAGWWDISDEMVEDLDFMVSEINNRGIYRLQMVEEAQLLNGAGTGATIQGLLNRSGIQTESAATGVSGADNADAVFRAITKVQTATGFSADGIVINPADYQALRLRKDANGQYFGGGFFSGQYGNGGVIEQPPLWGLRTVVTSAIASGTVAVGAFRQAATVYRKGGIRVESTNSDASKFTTNVITTRVEERVALAVHYPAAIVKVTLNYAAS